MVLSIILASFATPAHALEVTCTTYEAADYSVDGDPDTYRFADNLLVGERGSAVGSIGGICYDDGTLTKWKEAEWFDFVEVSSEQVEREMGRFVGPHRTRVEMDIELYSVFSGADASADYTLEYSTNGGVTWRPWFSESDDSDGDSYEVLSDVEYDDHARYIMLPSVVDAGQVRVRATVEGGHDTCEGEFDSANFTAKMNLSRLELFLCGSIL